MKEMLKKSCFQNCLDKIELKTPFLLGFSMCVLPYYTA